MGAYFSTDDSPEEPDVDVVGVLLTRITEVVRPFGGHLGQAETLLQISVDEFSKRNPLCGLQEKAFSDIHNTHAHTHTSPLQRKTTDKQMTEYFNASHLPLTRCFNPCPRKLSWMKYNEYFA